MMGSAVSLLEHSRVGQHFCLNLVSGITSLTLQGVSSEDMMDWATTLFHAKAIANGGGHLLDQERIREKAYEEERLRRRDLEEAEFEAAQTTRAKAAAAAAAEAAAKAEARARSEREAFEALTQEGEVPDIEEQASRARAAEQEAAKLVHEAEAAVNVVSEYETRAKQHAEEATAALAELELRRAEEKKMAEERERERRESRQRMTVEVNESMEEFKERSKLASLQRDCLDEINLVQFKSRSMDMEEMIPELGEGEAHPQEEEDSPDKNITPIKPGSGTGASNEKAGALGIETDSEKENAGGGKDKRASVRLPLDTPDRPQGADNSAKFVVITPMRPVNRPVTLPRDMPEEANFHQAPVRVLSGEALNRPMSIHDPPPTPPVAMSATIITSTIGSPSQLEMEMNDECAKQLQAQGTGLDEGTPYEKESSQLNSETSKTTQAEESLPLRPGMLMAEKMSSSYRQRANDDAELERHVMKWMESVLGQPFPPGESFGDCLKSGASLCQVINAIEPGLIPKISESGLAYKQMENISKFLQACRKLGLKQECLFETVDLFEAKDLKMVAQCIHALGQIVPSSSCAGNPMMKSCPSKQSSVFWRRGSLADSDDSDEDDSIAEGSELSQGINQEGTPALTDEVLKEAFSSLDVSGQSGGINVMQFASLWRVLTGEHDLFREMAQFAKFNTSGDSVLIYQEFERGFRALEEAEGTDCKILVNLRLWSKKKTISI
ncbi:unnamed protein product [Chrysoparadoxa australica]